MPPLSLEQEALASTGEGFLFRVQIPLTRMLFR